MYNYAYDKNGCVMYVLAIWCDLHSLSRLEEECANLRKEAEKLRQELVAVRETVGV